MSTTDRGEGTEPLAEAPRLATSLRDRRELRDRLTSWLATKVTDPVLTAFSAPETNGMSSETLLFDVVYRSGGARRTKSFAARLSADPEAVPVFPVYDLERQFKVMRLVGERTRIPVPRTFWLETDPEPIGASFFVMERIDGLVPPDVMPYTFGSWLSEAPVEDQQRLQRSSVEVLAQIHRMNASPEEIDFLQLRRPGDSPLRRHVADSEAYYEWVASDGIRSPLIERGFRWLSDHWPEETPSAVSWGDARIGNIIFRDFTPVAVLDWEMSAVGPPEIDVGWMIYLHRFLDDIALSAGLPGMPQFMRLDDVAYTYESLSGHAPRDLEFYTLYAALRHAIVMSRIARRQSLFGEAQMPADPDDTIMHRASLEQMLEGAYWRRF